MRAGLAIFVKTPGYSPLKSRLAADRGEAYALDWYRLAAAAVASVARRLQTRGRVEAYWAVAEPDAHPAWAELPTLAQGEGGLGERMASVHAQLVARHGAGVLLGADAPQLDVATLEVALDWLDDAAPRLVLGPALDGGFWCFGANRVVPTGAWTAVRYSAPDTATRLREVFAGAGAWLELPTLGDVDHGADLAPALQALDVLPDPTDAQRALVAWMRRHEATTA